MVNFFHGEFGVLAALTAFAVIAILIDLTRMLSFAHLPSRAVDARAGPRAFGNRRIQHPPTPPARARRPLSRLAVLVIHRVQIAHHRLGALVEHMGVDLGGRYVGVPEQILNDAKIGAVLKEMASEGVAQDMRT